MENTLKTDEAAEVIAQFIMERRHTGGSVELANGILAALDAAGLVIVPHDETALTKYQAAMRFSADFRSAFTKEREESKRIRAMLAASEAGE